MVGRQIDGTGRVNCDAMVIGLLRRTRSQMQITINQQRQIVRDEPRRRVNAARYHDSRPVLYIARTVRGANLRASAFGEAVAFG